MTGPATEVSRLKEKQSTARADLDALLAEGQKVCDAFAKGQTEEQAKAMIAADLGVDSGQFIGAVHAGNLCTTWGK